jgi:YHS domain-containing protein/thioredoxin-related protein
MRKTTGSIGLLATLLLLLPATGMAQQPIRWESTLDGAQRVASQSNRLVLVEFVAPWCEVCRRMEAEVFSQPSVGAQVSINYAPVRVNADQLPAIARQFGITALPTTVLITPQGQVLDSIRGRMEAGEYVARLNQVAAGYKQRAGGLYAQVPSAAAPAAPAQTPPAMGNMQPNNASGPLSGGMPQSANAGNQPMAASPNPAGSRYGDFGRRNSAAPTTPIAQPSTAASGPIAALPPPYNPPVQPATPPASVSSPMGVAAQPYPASQPPAALSAQAAPTSAYGAMAPQSAAPPMARPGFGNSAMPTSAAASAASPSSNNPLGLDGYCPVSLVEKSHWVMGDRRWGAVHRGRTYLFSGPEEQRRFFTDPDRYAPAVSGNDIVLATEQGQAAPGMREHGVFYGNRIYLFASEATLEKFGRNPGQYANQAMGAIQPGAYAGQQMR